MPDAPKHRRFRFGLRTFFIALTAFAFWLGWNVYQVRQRGRMEQYVATLTSRFESKPTSPIFYGPPRQPWKSLPIMWHLLGVKSVQTLNLRDVDIPETDRSYIRAWFPEAEIRFDEE
jgi:hypothetical protein